MSNTCGQTLTRRFTALRGKTTGIIVLLALAGSACGSATSPTPAPATTTAAPVTVSFMVSGDPAELAAYQKLVAGFQPSHSGIIVNLIHIPSSGNYTTRLAADFAAKTPPDVFLLNYRSYAKYAAAGALEPVQAYLAVSARLHEADFYAEALKPFRWAGQLTCLPQNISSLVVYYNRDLFAKAALPEPDANWTRDAFLNAAMALTRDVDGDGQTDQYGLGVEPVLIRAAPFIWQTKGSLVDSIVTPQHLALATPEATEALQWFVDLQTVHHVVPDAVAESAEDSETRFMNGTLGMFLQSRRPVPTFRTITKFQWDVAPLPSYKNRHASILHSDGYCLAAASPHKEAAWAFIEYANSVEGQTIIAATGRTVPSLKAVAESAAFLDPNAAPAHSQVWLDAIPSLDNTPVLKNWSDIEEVANDELTRAFYGQATLAEAMRSAAQRADEYFRP